MGHVSTLQHNLTSINWFTHILRSISFRGKVLCRSPFGKRIPFIMNSSSKNGDFLYPGCLFKIMLERVSKIRSEI